MEPVLIELFGGPRIRRGEQVVSRFPTRKTAALLGCLASCPGREHPREALVELLWPGHEPEAGRKSLSVALSALRKLLEPQDTPRGSVLRTGHHVVSLNWDVVSTDAAGFQTAAEEAMRTPADRRAALLQAAAARHGGALLPGFYEGWIPPEQARLDGLLRELLVELATLCREQGDLEAAIGAARRLVALDPLDEESHRLLIGLLGDAGRVAEALRQYRELERMLQRALGVAPSPESREVAARVRRQGGGETGAPQEGPAPERLPLSGPRIPAAWTRLVGRQGELETLLSHAAPGGARLLTLTGPGGSGKTRLACEAAERLRRAYEDRVCFVPLAELDDAQQIPQAVADALGLELQAGEPVCLQAAAAVAGRPALLVLDNLEHVLPAAGTMVRRFLENAPALTCVVTSRNRLGLPGERELHVAPLPVPGDVELARLAENASVELFLDRARAVRPGMELTEENAAAVARLCGQLEGLPLALELAGARADVLTPAQMVERLERGYAFLAEGGSAMDPRHCSLEASLEWSFRLLRPELQAFLTRLSVFRDGWTLEAAEAVCVEEGSPGGLEALSRLRECCLVFTEEAGSSMRFRMLEMLRQYAHGLLGPEEARQLQRRHRRFFVQWLDGLAPAHRQVERRREYANLRAALESAAGEPGAAEDGYRIAWRLSGYWNEQGLVPEGSAHVNALLRADDGTSARLWRIRALLTAASLEVLQGRHAAARPHCEEAAELARQEGNPAMQSWALYQLGQAEAELGESEPARAHLEESLRLKQEHGDPWGLAATLAALGNLDRFAGEYGRARSWYEQSLEFASGTGDRRCAARALECLGVLAREEGDLGAAREYLERALGIRRELDEASPVAATLAHLAEVDLRERRLEPARERLTSSLDLSRTQGDRAGTARALGGLGRVALAAGDTRHGRDLLAQSLELWAACDRAREVAEALDALAGALVEQGEALVAARLLGAAASIREGAGAQPPPAVESERARVLALVRQRAGERAVAAVAEGRRLRRDAAVSLALRSAGRLPPGPA